MPYCLALIEDASAARDLRPIVTDRVHLVVSTDSSIAVGCQCDVEGETEFRLGTRLEADPGSPPIFQGQLKTPSRKLAIRSVLDDVVLEIPVSQPETTISIWVNHPTVPDQVIVGVDSIDEPLASDALLQLRAGKLMTEQQKAELAAKAALADSQYLDLQDEVDAGKAGQSMKPLQR